MIRLPSAMPQSKSQVSISRSSDSIQSIITINLDPSSLTMLQVNPISTMPLSNSSVPPDKPQSPISMMFIGDCISTMSQKGSNCMSIATSIKILSEAMDSQHSILPLFWSLLDSSDLCSMATCLWFLTRWTLDLTIY